MISSYRLGDLVLLDLNINEKYQLIIEHPNSIGAKFIIEKINNPYQNNIELITKIVLNFIKLTNDFYPKDISNSTLIHLRLGDVVCGNHGHEIGKRPLDVKYLKSLVINNNNSKKYVIGKCFFAKTSSNNYDECIKESNNYLHKVLKELNAEHLDLGNADLDLCCAIKCKLFIQGRGFYSKLIAEIRKKLNLETIETQVYTS